MLERYLVEYCSPTLASIKTANLFNVPYASWKELDGQLESLKQQFAEKYGIISIGIFGSVARGEQHEESDLDVFVELKDPDPFIMFDIKEELERICNCKIDLLRLRKNLRSLISQRIARDGIYA